MFTVIRHPWVSCTCLAAVALVLAGTGALAQPATVPATPQQTTATFGDWTLRCVRLPAGTKACELVQVVQQDGKPLAQIAIGATAKGKPLQVTVLLPLNVSFGSSPALLPPGDGHAGTALAWRRCLPGGCIAEAEIDKDVVAQLRGWTQAARIVFPDAAARAVTLPFSPTGLPQALDALAKEDAG